jgi:uncharacterized phage protein (TIGR02218 family)
MTTRQYSAALQAHLDTYGTTLCFLLKITAKDGSKITVTSLDQDLDYDDGGGTLTYLSVIGLETSPQSYRADLDVDNSEATLLQYPSGDFTEEKISAGVLDFADFIVYRINYKKPEDGHYIVTSGTTGAIRAMDGLAGVVELRGISQALKQTAAVELYSITCRATFGSQDGDEPFPCFFDTTSLWSSDTVLSVDSEEPDRVFTATTTPAATGPNGPVPSFVPGIVKFTSGQNSGAYVEIESLVGDVITLRFALPFDIASSDGYDIRPDCAKRWREDCINIWDNELWFRGEPHIAAGDEASQVTPGATYPIVGFYGPAEEP